MKQPESCSSSLILDLCYISSLNCTPKVLICMSNMMIGYSEPDPVHFSITHSIGSVSMS